MKEPKITKEIVKEHGLTEEEYELVLKTLGREPTYTELGIVSVMWSEHASYKNSIKYLKTLPREGKRLLTKTGEENAGVVDIGSGYGISFKIESHNHPSASEPYHGAATGVGGILRDIFTMGARPIALLNSLRFGNPEDSEHLLKNVVLGIADYGNGFGAPTVGGEIYFEDSYAGNPLVNAMAVGIVKHQNMMKASAEGVGNYVVYVGADTGRDGIHGATFASVELTEESEESRTAVQVGDPFTEKLLLEATLEVIEKKLIEGLQDMGAAGLTCSSSEMAAKTGNGIEIDVSLVPQREKGMNSYEIMLSESQERMLMIVKPENFEDVKEVFEKWDLNAVNVGRVTADGLLRVKEGDVVKAELPAKLLVLGGDAPVYDREIAIPKYREQIPQFDDSTIEEPTDLNDVFIRMITSPNLCSRKSVYTQYDHHIQTNTVIEPGGDAALIRIKETGQGLALTTDCNGRHCYLNPYEGTKAAVAEAARNIVCCGATPIAISNCLNFGNPYKPEVYWTFVEAIRGMSDACRAFDTPVTGGNVSFYNETPQSAVYPTPVIAMIGLIDDYHKAIKTGYKNENDLIILLGERANRIGGSEYLKVIHNTIDGEPPAVDLEKELALHKATLELIDKGLLNSAHDCSDGGLAISLVEGSFNSAEGIGAKINIDFIHRVDFELFGEIHSRIICSSDPANLEQIKATCSKYNVPCEVIGTVGGKSLIIEDNNGNRYMEVEIEKAKQLWLNALPI